MQQSNLHASQGAKAGQHFMDKNTSQMKDKLAGRYGSRSGFVRTYWHRMYYLLGHYQHYQQIDWKSVQRLVFVCKGNVCRSAYAEAVARELKIESISCGIDTSIGAPANADAMRAAARKGFDLGNHKTTPIKSLTFRENDILIAMEPRQAQYLNQEFGDKNRCSLLGLWGQPVTPHIQDPFGASEEYFDNCFNYIEVCIHEIAGKI